MQETERPTDIREKEQTQPNNNIILHTRRNFKTGSPEKSEESYDEMKTTGWNNSRDDDDDGVSKINRMQ